MGGAVELIQEQDLGLIACPLIPVRGIESGDLAVRGWETNHITFGHLGETPVNHRIILKAFLCLEDTCS
jgi:hypothetical protein